MAPGDEEPPPRRTDSETVEFGSGGESRRSRSAWLLGGVGVLVAAVVAVLVIRQQAGPAAVPDDGGSTTAVPSSPPASPTDTPSPSASSSSPPPSTSAPTRDAQHLRIPTEKHPVVTQHVDLSGLHAPEGWELFAHTQDMLVRMQPAHDRITLTRLPSTDEHNPSAFVVGSDQVLVSMPNQGAARLVPDGKPARKVRFPDTMVQVLPGPDGRHVWTIGLGNPMMKEATTVRLVDPTRQTVKKRIKFPSTLMAWGTRPDKQGYLLVRGIGGYYDVRPDGIHRVTTGTVLAAGPTRFLALECDESMQCGYVVIDRTDGARRQLDIDEKLTVRAVGLLSGVISPDGSTAALRDYNGETGRLLLIDLESGEVKQVHLKLWREGLAGQQVVWSPDSEWVYAIGGAREDLQVVNAETGQVSTFDVKLPKILQIAARTS